MIDNFIEALKKGEFFLSTGGIAEENGVAFYYDKFSLYEKDINIILNNKNKKETHTQNTTFFSDVEEGKKSDKQEKINPPIFG